MDMSRTIPMCLITLALMIKLGQSSNNLFKQCDPAEEGLPHILKFSWNLFNKSMDVFINRRDNIAACTRTPKCRDMLINKTYTDFVIDLSKNRVTITVEIYNISRNDVLVADGDWEIKNKSNGYILLQCKLNVFFRVQHISCSYQILNGNLSIICSTSKVYPQAKCQFLINTTQIYSLPDEYLSYNSTTLQGNPVYFASSCTATIPSSMLTHGYFYIVVTMYPDVTNKGNDNAYGLNKTVYILLESPSVRLKDCPKVNNGYYHGTCTCEMNDTNFVNATINWYDKNGNMIQTDESNVLSFYFSSMVTVFYCQAKNNLGWESNNVIFSPYTLSPPQLVDTFENSTTRLLNFGSDNIITIMLNISGYPKPQNYSIVKNCSDEIDFENVTDGNAKANVFRIQYIDDVIPYGTLNLTFSILKEEDITNYLFVVDNGVSPPLKYDIFIERDNTTDQTDFKKTVASLFAVAMIVALFIFIGIVRHSRLKSNINNNVLQEEVVYEEIGSREENNDRHDATNDVSMRCSTRHNAISSIYDAIDESWVVEDNASVPVCTTVIFINSKRGELENETLEDTHGYYKLKAKWVAWDDEYIAIIGDTASDESERVIVFDDGSKDATDRNSAIWKVIRYHLEYNTVKEIVYSLHID